jgi:hypothetical protein
MGIVVSLLDALGVVLVATVLFLPVVWFVAYGVWEVFHWGTRSKEIYSLEELPSKGEIIPAPSKALVTQEEAPPSHKIAA